MSTQAFKYSSKDSSSESSWDHSQLKVTSAESMQGARDGDVVEHLYGLELDETRAVEPSGHDVVRELRVGTSCHPQGSAHHPVRCTPSSSGRPGNESRIAAAPSPHSELDPRTPNVREGRPVRVGTSSPCILSKVPV